MKSIVSLCIFLFIFFFSVFNSTGQLRLPKLISNGMILQRNAKVKIWGKASANENIEVRFIDSTYKTVADLNGDWELYIRTPDAGGPYQMFIRASNSLVINDILLGDVWICSGQSNMELPMRRVNWVYQNEILESENSRIRQFYVPRSYNFNNPTTDFSGGSWISANPETVLDFSAVAYFFAKEINRKFEVPVGIINTSLGGSPIEAWMSEEALSGFPAYLNEAQKFKDSSLILKIESEDNQRITNWYTLLRQKDEGYKNQKQLWYDPYLKTAEWSKINVPGYWADTDFGKMNGVFWFRKKITIDSTFSGKPAILLLGRIVDSDSVFFNGTFIGSTAYQYPPRRYIIPANLLKAGENTIAVRIISNSGSGGFVPDKPYFLISGIDTIDLKGEWQCKLGAKMEPLAGQTFIRWKPTGLFNAMIAPLTNYAIKGVIWYQGESNIGREIEYRKLFPDMVMDWRKKWKQGNFPFLFVQLPNFNEPQNTPSESQWALMRESQLLSLNIPNTGMAVTIDIGEWNDIHPLKKKDVGNRLAMAAQKMAYGDSNIISSGPAYESMKIKGKKIYLTFKNTGSGLMVRGGNSLTCFSIAGTDKKFIWAKAIIKNNKVIVWNKSIKNPSYVRYAWADNPKEANLFNHEGLPASPFRTDN